MEMEDNSIAVRRTARARKVNPRFVGDDIDENYMKLVGRITASNYSGNKDSENLKDLDMDPEREKEGSVDNLSISKEGSDSAMSNSNSSIQNILTFIPSNRSGTSVNIALKTISFKKKKNKKKDGDYGGKHASSLPGQINQCRSSTESEVSEESAEYESERKRKIYEIDAANLKKLKKDSDNALLSIQNLKNYQSDLKLHSFNECSVSIPKNDKAQADSSLTRNNTSIIPILPKSFVPISIGNKIEQNQPKILLTSKSKLDLPGKKLKIVSLKPITTLKDRPPSVTPDPSSSENFGNQLLLSKGGPVELKIVKKDIHNLNVVSNLESKKLSEKENETPITSETKLKTELTEIRDSSPKSHIFSSDGEDDIPLNKLIEKQSVPKKKKVSKEQKLKKKSMKSAKDSGGKSAKSTSLLKKSSDQDDLPLKSFLKKSKSFSKGLSDKFKSNIRKKQKLKSAENLGKKNKSQLKEVGQHNGSNALSKKTIKKSNEIGKKSTGADKSVDVSAKKLVVKKKKQNLESKMKAEQKKMKLNELKSKNQNIKLIKKKNEGKSPKIKKKKTDEKGFNKLRFKFPNKKQVKKDTPLANETTNIVISVSGIEGDYACVAIEKDHLPSEKDNSSSPKLPSPKKVNKSGSTESGVSKVYTSESGLVLEESLVSEVEAKKELPTESLINVKEESSNKKKSKDPPVASSFDLSKKLNEIAVFKKAKKFKEFNTSKNLDGFESDELTVKKPKGELPENKVEKEPANLIEIKTEMNNVKSSEYLNKNSSNSKEKEKTQEYVAGKERENKKSLIRSDSESGKGKKSSEIKKHKVSKADVKRENSDNEENLPKIDFSSESKNNSESALKKEIKSSLGSEGNVKRSTDPNFKESGTDKINQKPEPSARKPEAEKIKIDITPKKHDKEEIKGEQGAKKLEKDSLKSKSSKKHEKDNIKSENIIGSSKKQDKEAISSLSYKKQNKEIFKVESPNSKEEKESKCTITLSQKVDKEPSNLNMSMNTSEVKMDLSPNKTEKENTSSTASVKGKRKENFEEALSCAPLPKLSKHKSSDGKNVDRKKESSEKAKKSKDVKPDVSLLNKFKDYLSDSKKDSSRLDSSNIKSESSNKELKREKHKEDKKHSRSEKKRHDSDSKDHIKVELSSSYSHDDRSKKRKREEKERRHSSSHKKHKREKDHHDSHRRSHSYSSEIRFKDSSNKERKHKYENDAEKATKEENKFEDNKDIIINKMIDSSVNEKRVKKEAEIVMSSKSDKEAETPSYKGSTISNYEMKPEVLIEEENIQHVGNANIKDEDDGSNTIARGLSVDEHFGNNAKLENIISNQLQDVKIQPKDNSLMDADKCLKYNTKDDNVSKTEATDDVVESPHIEDCSVVTSKDLDGSSDLGILEELRNLKEMKNVETHEIIKPENSSVDEPVKDLTNSGGQKINTIDKKPQNDTDNKPLISKQDTENLIENMQDCDGNVLKEAYSPSEKAEADTGLDSEIEHDIKLNFEDLSKDKSDANSVGKGQEQTGKVTKGSGIGDIPEPRGQKIIPGKEDSKKEECSVLFQGNNLKNQEMFSLPKGPAVNTHESEIQSSSMKGESDLPVNEELKDRQATSFNHSTSDEVKSVDQNLDVASSQSEPDNKSMHIFSSISNILPSIPLPTSPTPASTKCLELPSETALEMESYVSQTVEENLDKCMSSDEPLSNKENTSPPRDFPNSLPVEPYIKEEDKIELTPPKKELTPEEKEEKERENKKIVEERMKSFDLLDENLYLVERVKNKRSKEAKRMVCDCTLSKEEILNNEMGCGDDCLNKLLMIECGSRCPLKDSCMNKKFQQKAYAEVEVFNAEEKGCGVRACENIKQGTFLMEYIGEVFDTKEFKRRRKEYAKGSSAHFYFMALRPDRLIDATRKGNISRFINHSCSPNAETQKWTVNGDIRIGFFSTKNISVGEEINFDYRLERYGREPQKCFCGTPECRGWLGEPPDQKTKEEKEEDRKKEMKDRQRREGRRSFFEDMDLEDEIEKLTARGLRNRQDTLNLSRLMVRCEDSSSRLSLLKILETCEEASKRLFLDYHGLKLLWSWMVDISASHKCIPLKLEILKTLKSLPITNKTQVTDSKIMSVVERWSKLESKIEDGDGEKTKSAAEVAADKKLSDGSEESDTETSEAKDSDPSSSDTVSPDDSSQDSSEAATEIPKDEGESKDSGDSNLTSDPAVGAEDEVVSPEDEESSVPELASQLLKVWTDLKEAFKIPKKKRIEMMKEHEREVDQEYEKYLYKKRDSLGDRGNSYDRWRYSSGDRQQRNRERRRDREKRWSRREEEDKGLSAEERRERRERFAQQVAKEDEEARQRKFQEEMWTLHIERCTLLGHDPYFTPMFDPTGQYYWDPSLSNWQPYSGPNGNLPVPASYGINAPESSENISPNIPTNNNHQMFLTSSLFALPPHAPVSDLDRQQPGSGSSVPEDEASTMPLDPASIPLPGETLPKGSSPETPVVAIPLPGEGDDMDIETSSGIETPPLAPPGPVTIKLPAKWKMARDNERRIYFYHSKTRFSQWDLPTSDLHTQLMSQYGLTSDSESDPETDDSDSSSSSDSEDFSSDEEEAKDEEVIAPAVQKGGDGEIEKMIRRPKGKKVRSEKLVQERVISPILFEDREAARRERKEAKERAREEARKERWNVLKALKAGTGGGGGGSGGAASGKPSSTAAEADRTAPSDDGVISPNEEEDNEHLEEQLIKYSSRKQKLESKSHTKAKGRSKERAATALADTSDIARKIKDNFRSRMATYIVSVLNPYRKPECKEGRITSNDDFKYLARKLTHFVMVKELKQLPSIDELDCSESVKHKTKEFVRKYMCKYGETFKRDPNDTKEY